MDVRVCVVSEERVIEDEVLGRGERVGSSTVPSDAEAKEPIIVVRLNRHVGEEECVDVSDVASRAGRCVNIEELRLDARLWVDVLEGSGTMEGARVGLVSVTTVVAVEVDTLRF